GLGLVGLRLRLRLLGHFWFSSIGLRGGHLRGGHRGGGLGRKIGPAENRGGGLEVRIVREIAVPGAGHAAAATALHAGVVETAAESCFELAGRKTNGMGGGRDREKRNDQEAGSQQRFHNTVPW